MAGRQTKGIFGDNKNIYVWSRPLIQNEEECGPPVSHNDIMRIARDSRSVDECLAELVPVQQGQAEFVHAYESSSEEARLAE